MWKCADVLPLAKIPIPKSVDTDLRPISLTAVLSKVLEGFVFSWLYPIVMPQIDLCQFGGIKNSSTTHALVRLIHEWLQATEAPKTVIRSCFIDFSKAFDRIDHNILIHKLRMLGVPQILLNWCASFLQDRQQRVKLGQIKSSWRYINAGVPQGSKLGPLLFLVMINDLTTSLPIYKYIDDCTVFEVLTPSRATSTIQKEVDYINQWSTTNNMRLNIKKTKELTICFAKSQLPFDPLVINNQPLESVQSFKLLGIHIQSDLKWNLHIEATCSKASKRLYALRCLKRSGVSPKDLRTVYSCFIRPVLEYACPVWHSSLTASLCDDLEQIQRRATKIILPSMSYSDRLMELDLPTLRERRQDLCRRFYKSVMRSDDRIHDILPAPEENMYSFRCPRTLPLIKCRTKRFQNSFIPFAIRSWDASP